MHMLTEATVWTRRFEKQGRNILLELLCEFHVASQGILESCKHALLHCLGLYKTWARNMGAWVWFVLKVLQLDVLVIRKNCNAQATRKLPKARPSISTNRTS